MRRYLWTIMAALALLAGCSRNDQQVATDVQNKINSDTSFPDKGLSVSASNGVVTLSGNVSSDAARNAAANDAAQVPGVKTVINNLQVTGEASAGPAGENPTAAQTSANLAPPPGAAVRPSARSRSRSSSSAANDYTRNSGGQTTSPDSTSAATTAPPAPAPAPAPQPVSIPTGTQISIRLTDQLDSEKAQVGDVFHASIASPI